MASRRCLKCGYPLTEGSNCFCDAPTIQKRELAPWPPTPASASTPTTPEQAEPKPSLPQHEKDKLNLEYRKIKSFWDHYQAQPSAIRELADAYHSILELSFEGSQYASRPEILEELCDQIEQEYWRRYPYARPHAESG